jgi:hypothetical protein
MFGGRQRTGAGDGARAPRPPLRSVSAGWPLAAESRHVPPRILLIAPYRCASLRARAGNHSRGHQIRGSAGGPGIRAATAAESERRCAGGRIGAGPPPPPPAGRTHTRSLAPVSAEGGGGGGVASGPRPAESVGALGRLGGRAWVVPCGLSPRRSPPLESSATAGPPAPTRVASRGLRRTRTTYRRPAPPPPSRGEQPRSDCTGLSAHRGEGVGCRPPASPLCAAGGSEGR